MKTGSIGALFATLAVLVAFSNAMRINSRSEIVEPVVRGMGTKQPLPDQRIPRQGKMLPDNEQQDDNHDQRDHDHHDHHGQHDYLGQHDHHDHHDHHGHLGQHDHHDHHGHHDDHHGQRDHHDKHDHHGKHDCHHQHKESSSNTSTVLPDLVVNGRRSMNDKNSPVGKKPMNISI